MSLLSGIRAIKVPAPADILSIPKKLKTETSNQKINEVNIRYFDRFFKKFLKLKGIKEHKTSVPIVYFDTPDKLAVIIFDDCEYLDEEGNVWIDVCEDYPFALNQNTELVQELNIQYYNDFAENKIATRKGDEGGNLQYKIPVLLNRIPREIVRINTHEKMQQVDKAYLNNKIEITQYIIRQISKVIMLERVGKKDNSFILTGVLLGGSMGIIVGIFISFAFLR